MTVTRGPTSGTTVTVEVPCPTATDVAQRAGVRGARDLRAG